MGGNSADESAWVPAPASLPAGDGYRITDIDLLAYATAVPLWGGSLTLGTSCRRRRLRFACSKRKHNVMHSHANPLAPYRDEVLQALIFGTDPMTR